MRKGQMPKASDPGPKAEINNRPTQERILAAAEELFAEAGYEGTSIRQIALKAGVPVALISYHFGGKLGVRRAYPKDQRRRLRSGGCRRDDPAHHPADFGRVQERTRDEGRVTIFEDAMRPLDLFRSEVMSHVEKL